MTTSYEDIQYSAHKYVEYCVGQLNMIISVPHGGGLKPHSIPNRDAGSLLDGGQCVYNHKYQNKKDPVKYPVKFKKDMNTLDLAAGIANELNRLSGKRPHVIINHLYRGKMDPNCDREKGAFCVPAAEEAWTAYHTFIETAQKTINKPGLVCDIHGQVHSEDWIELGYTLTAGHLNDHDYTPEMTSVYSLFRHSIAGVKEINDLISGELSLGALLSAEGYKVVPSPNYPSPGTGSYYTGGFITEMHGSKNGSKFDAIQIESPSSLRSKENVLHYSKVLGSVMYKFVTMHYA